MDRRPGADYILMRIKQCNKLSARRQTFGEAHARVDDTLLPGERPLLVLLGKIDRLNRDGD